MDTSTGGFGGEDEAREWDGAEGFAKEPYLDPKDVPIVLMSGV